MKWLILGSCWIVFGPCIHKRQSAIVAIDNVCKMLSPMGETWFIYHSANNHFHIWPTVVGCVLLFFLLLIQPVFCHELTDHIQLINWYASIDLLSMNWHSSLNRLKGYQKILMIYLFVNKVNFIMIFQLTGNPRFCSPFHHAARMKSY